MHGSAPRAAEIAVVRKPSRRWVAIPAVDRWGSAKVQFIVSLDTEADNQWRHGIPLTCRNVGYWHDFQDLCLSTGVIPTYLITSEIAEDPVAATMLREWVGQGRAEVGAHLHPWTTAPFVDADGLRFNDERHLFPSALREDLLRAKLQVLTAQIVENVGVRPLSYRAGRFGMSTTTAGILAELGYLVDSSVTPLVSWGTKGKTSSSLGGPDFRRHTAAPFIIAGSGVPGLLEMPVTVMVTNRTVRRHAVLTRAYLSRPARVARRLVHRGRSRPQPVWLRPSPLLRASDLEAVWNAAEEDGLTTVVMMFHSSELMPGGSPYWPSQDAVTDLLATLDGFFRFALRNGGRPTTMTGAARGLLSAASLEERSL